MQPAQLYTLTQPASQPASQSISQPASHLQVGSVVAVHAIRMIALKSLSPKRNYSQQPTRQPTCKSAL